MGIRKPFNNTAVYKNSAQREYDITDAKRAWYRKLSHESRLSKLSAEQGLLDCVHAVNIPQFSPDSLMPQMQGNGLTAISLFSGGGGLDLGFIRAGYSHVASYELIPICKQTLLPNLQCKNIHCGPGEGDVTKIDWSIYKGKVDVVHGGPPCQPFSVAGAQKGGDDKRNMWGEFSRAVNAIKPKVFVAENVPGILNPKFKDFVQKHIHDQLADYAIAMFEMRAADYGVPQVRKRVFFVGFRNKKMLSKFSSPQPTHTWAHLGKQSSHQTGTLFDDALFDSTLLDNVLLGNPPLGNALLDSASLYKVRLDDAPLDSLDKTSLNNALLGGTPDNAPPKNRLQKTCGVRECLGLPNIGFDNLAPTIRSAFTGKRNTTSVLSSTAGQKAWADMQIWPNGVQANRQKASAFPAKNGHFRLSVQDVALIQGFPESWEFAGAVYQQLGQIGNSVAPPVAYHVARAVQQALL